MKSCLNTIINIITVTIDISQYMQSLLPVDSHCFVSQSSSHFHLKVCFVVVCFVHLPPCRPRTMTVWTKRMARDCRICFSFMVKEIADLETPSSVL